MLTLTGSLPTLHPQRPLDPDQPPLLDAHSIPGDQMYTIYWGWQFLSEAEIQSDNIQFENPAHLDPSFLLEGK